MSSLDQDPQQVAREHGLELVIPTDHDVFVDFDEPSIANEDKYQQMVATLRRNGLLIEEIRRTKSHGGGTHIYLRTPHPISPLERIILQACLGSDLVREVLSYLRIYHHLDRAPTCFFETPT